MGGLAVATLLTLLFLPALYASWYGATRPCTEVPPKPVLSAATLAKTAPI
jgi:hypothetical protein